MIKHKSKVEAAREVNLLVVQDSGVIFLVPNVHLVVEKSSGTCKEDTAKFLSLLAKHLGSFKHDQNQNKVLLCYTATLKNPVSINKNYSNVICIIHWEKSALRWKWWSNPRSKQLKEVDVWRQIIFSFPQYSSTKVHRKINVSQPYLSLNWFLFLVFLVGFFTF